MNLAKLALPASLFALLTAAACGGDDGGPSDTGDGFESHADAPEIVSDFADDVVVPTYSTLADRLAELQTAAETLAADPSEATLVAAQDAWRASRVPWESSEGFLFGPVDSLGIDPALDSWPVDRNALDAVLAGDDELTVAFVGGLDATLHGYHTAEYLLFGAESARVVGDLGERELAYLTAVTTLMAEEGARLAGSWTAGVDEAMPYADLFKTAGAAGNNVYPSLSSAGEEIVRGMIGIADEVANGKIADPFDQQDTKLVESQFAFNSLTDFQNNVRSIQNAYTADVDFAGTEGAGVDDYVAAVDPELDARVQAEIEAALTALAAIPEPFRDAILDETAADSIVTAQEAIRTVQTTLEEDVLPLFI